MPRRPPPPSLLKRIWQNSQTKYLAYVQALSSAFLLAADELNGVVTNSTVSTALNQIKLPSWFPWLLLSLAVLTYVAHAHKDDNA